MAINKKVYKKLIEVAKAQQLISYSDLVAQVGLNLDLQNAGDRTKISTILDNISSFEAKAGRPMLSAVVVKEAFTPGSVRGVGIRSPGSGFYALGEKLGLKKTSEHDFTFHGRMLKELFNYWKEATI